MIKGEWPDLTGNLADLKEFLGRDVVLLKTGVRTEKGFKLLDPIQRASGEMSVVDRGGGPAVLLQGRGFDYFITSWVLKADRTSEGIEIETENSLYLIKLNGPTNH